MDRRIFEKGSPLRFVLTFLSLFLLLHYFNILFFGLTTPENHYSPFLDNHLNYIRGLRHLLLGSSEWLLRLAGYDTVSNDMELLVAGKGHIRVLYSCLGLGVMSFLTAFVIAFPATLRQKLVFLLPALIIIQLLNILRFVLLALFWKSPGSLIIDHHTVFDAIIYVLIVVSLYVWVQRRTRMPV